MSVHLSPPLVPDIASLGNIAFSMKFSSSFCKSDAMEEVSFQRVGRRKGSSPLQDKSRLLQSATHLPRRSLSLSR